MLLKAIPVFPLRLPECLVVMMILGVNDAHRAVKPRHSPPQHHAADLRSGTKRYYGLTGLRGQTPQGLQELRDSCEAA